MLGRAIVAYVALRNKWSKKKNKKSQAQESSSGSKLPRQSTEFSNFHAIVKEGTSSLDIQSTSPHFSKTVKMTTPLDTSDNIIHKQDPKVNSENADENPKIPEIINLQNANYKVLDSEKNLELKEAYISQLNDINDSSSIEAVTNRPIFQSTSQDIPQFSSSPDNDNRHIILLNPSEDIISKELGTSAAPFTGPTHSLTYPLEQPSAARRSMGFQEADKRSLPTNFLSGSNGNSTVVSNEVVISSIVTTQPFGQKSSNFSKNPTVSTAGDPQAKIKETPTEEIYIDNDLAEGTSLLKVSATKRHQRTFKIDVDQGRILWDSKKSGKVNIENIKELRIGEAARNYRENLKLSSDYESRWFTIIYVDSGKYKALHLVAPTEQLFRKWVDTLAKLNSHRRDMMGGLGHMRRRQSLWLKQHWKQADKDGNSKLVVDEVVRLCRQLNINMSKELLKSKFDEADKRKNGWLEFSDFQRFVKLIKRREELEDIFSVLAKTDQEILTLSEFRDFLINEQKFNLADEDYGYLYHKFLDKDRHAMTLEGFNSFLMSSDNPVFSLEHSKVYQDMTQPLSHYFIQSSHNTYLLGHQLTGESSIEGYIRVLQRGCRCVEIDCWDGTDGPIVTHGHTLTSKILFQDVISAIRTYAFKASPYPLILSLEIHCSVEQQNVMARILRETLGEYLVVGFLKPNEEALPSPADLLYKILIKGKNITLENAEDTSVDSATDNSATDTESEAEPLQENLDSPKKKSKIKKSKPRISKELSDLVIYCSAVKFKGFNYHRENSSYYHMSSFSERVSSRLGKLEKEALIRHNIRHLTRIYPAGFRINSSNYEPHHHWQYGSQIVALNWQTFDLGLQINQAMFGVNGRCGYVLKPKRLKNLVFDIAGPPINKKPNEIELRIQIISAQQLPRPRDQTKGEIVDPFVEVELLVPSKEVQKRRTKSVSDNGFNPIWKENLSFRIDCEEAELVFLRFVVYDVDVRNNEFIASYCIPVASLQPGYRHIPLNDQNGDQFLFTSLLIHSIFDPHVFNFADG
ncbi:hypothetical protein G9A89_003448 [Geosiphon pyriformis]|nr:hypothetical protein G9A89_003448 [Geosiphon pyriformis]